MSSSATCGLGRLAEAEEAWLGLGVFVSRSEDDRSGSDCEEGGRGAVAGEDMGASKRSRRQAKQKHRVVEPKSGKICFLGEGQKRASEARLVSRLALFESEIALSLLNLLLFDVCCLLFVVLISCLSVVCCLIVVAC